MSTHSNKKTSKNERATHTDLSQRVRRSLKIWKRPPTYATKRAHTAHTTHKPEHIYIDDFYQNTPRIKQRVLTNGAFMYPPSFRPPPPLLYPPPRPQKKMFPCTGLVCGRHFAAIAAHFHQELPTHQPNFNLSGQLLYPPPAREINYFPFMGVI